MSEFTFRRAIREGAPVLIGLAGSSGSGKTFSALRLATGLAGGKRFAVIDTENARASHYADKFAFDRCDLRAPFTPERYIAAIDAAEKAAYPVIVVDSMSHEWSGDGGCLDMQEAELDRMAGDNYQKREACKMAAWIKPKSEHKRLVSRLLQMKAHIIFCMRAEEKVKMHKVDGRTKIEPVGWQPICEKNLPYEMTASFLLTDIAPGSTATPTKLQDQHRAFFGSVIDESAGQKLLSWCNGGTAKEQTNAKPSGVSADLLSDVKSILLGKESVCLEWMIRYGWLSDGQSFADLSEERAQGICKAPQRFITLVESGAAPKGKVPA